MIFILIPSSRSNVNEFDGSLDKSSLIIKNNKQISNQYVDIEELDEGLEELVDNPDNSIIPLDAFVAKAIRDGITVEQLANARYQDFDLVKNTVKIKKK